jgi:uncharacterized protein
MTIPSPAATATLELPRRGLRAEVTAPDLEIREAEDQDGSVEFEGYAMRWGEEAEIGFFFTFIESFRKGAFSRTIRDRGPAGNGQIKFKMRHNGLMENAAKFLDLREDRIGLRFRAKTIGTDAGRNLAVELREGVLDTLSIGFDALREEIDRDQDPVLRTVVEARLFEISAVDWPAYAGATVESIRDQQLRSFFDELEAELREGKVLSAVNRTRLAEARDRIQVVLDTAGDSDDEERSETATLSHEEHNDLGDPSPEADEDLDLELDLRERELYLVSKGA